LALTSFNAAIKQLWRKTLAAVHRNSSKSLGWGLLHFFWMRSGKTTLQRSLFMPQLLLYSWLARAAILKEKRS
jgi:DMSO/TMAO reductase YedYZ heme-binding membrane subunit